MRILIPASVAHRLAKILERRGLTETGGVLMGEHVSTDEFRIVDFTVQRSRGTFASFLRLPNYHEGLLERFFRHTDNNFRRFNYLGEWHSHPSFDVRPSGSDVAAMREIVDDTLTGATFAVLVIVRLRQPDMIEAGAFLFIPDAAEVFPASLFLECPNDSAKCTDASASFLKQGERLLAKIGWEGKRQPADIKLTAHNDDADVNDAE